MRNQRNDISSVLLGAAFLMATSAIGPGFLTQTVTFTAQLKTDFAFAILISIILDIIAQLNIWRIVTIAEKPAQELCNDWLRGSGYFLAILIALGGLVFNIGNIAGCSLGLNVLFQLPLAWGAGLSAIIAILILGIKEANQAMDAFTKGLGILMIGLTAYIAWASQPPIYDAAKSMILPQKIDFKAIITIVGGTVGGYISFAGAHRLLDANIKGIEKQKEVNRGAVMGIAMASLMRLLLFLGALGVIVKGFLPDANNPPASVFQQAAGEWGYRFFGIVLWSAAITSVIGSAYTSISFIKSFHPYFSKKQGLLVSIFILISTLIFISIGKPVSLLVFAGLINGFILPIALAILLLCVESKKIFPNYQHPLWLKWSGWAIVVLLIGMSLMSL